MAKVLDNMWIRRLQGMTTAAARTYLQNRGLWGDTPYISANQYLFDVSLPVSTFWHGTVIARTEAEALQKAESFVTGQYNTLDICCGKIDKPEIA